MSKQIDPNHSQKRDILRIIGPAVIFLALIFILIGFVDFFSAFGTMRAPRYFWCLFIGIPLFGVGGAISQFAYIGAMTRFMAGEVAPVSKDVTQYMVHETKGSVRDLAAAVGAGLTEGMNVLHAQPRHCKKCDTENDSSANFCKACGNSLTGTLECAECGSMNDPDARFCKNCGKQTA